MTRALLALALCAAAGMALAQVTVFPSYVGDSTVSVGTTAPGGVTITQPAGAAPACSGEIDLSEGCPQPMLGL